MIPLPHDHMQMRLPSRPRIPDPRLEHVLRLLDKLAMEIDGVLGNVPRGVVLAEDELGGLLVVSGLLRLMALALFGELFGESAVSGRVGLLRLLCRVSMTFMCGSREGEKGDEAIPRERSGETSMSENEASKKPYPFKTILLLIPLTPRQIPQPIILRLCVIARAVVERCFIPSSSQVSRARHHHGIPHQGAPLMIRSEHTSRTNPPQRNPRRRHSNRVSRDEINNLTQ
jgi:hypothetical protein